MLWVRAATPDAREDERSLEGTQVVEVLLLHHHQCGDLVGKLHRSLTLEADGLHVLQRERGRGEPEFGDEIGERVGSTEIGVRERSDREGMRAGEERERGLTLMILAFFSLGSATTRSVLASSRKQ